MLDFVGQAATPSKPHLLALDILITLVQFLIIILAYGETSSSSSSSTSTSISATSPVIGSADDSNRMRGSALLGDEEFREEDEDEDEDGMEDEEQDWEDDESEIGEKSYGEKLGEESGNGTSDFLIPDSNSSRLLRKRLSSHFSTSSLSSSISRREIPDHRKPITDIRLRAVWNELAGRRPDEAVAMEEGRSGSGGVRRRRRSGRTRSGSGRGRGMERTGESEPMTREGNESTTPEGSPLL